MDTACICGQFGDPEAAISFDLGEIWGELAGVLEMGKCRFEFGSQLNNDRPGRGRSANFGNYLLSPSNITNSAKLGKL